MYAFAASRSCWISACTCSALRRATCWISASSATCDALMPRFLACAYRSELMVKLTVRLAALGLWDGALTSGAYRAWDPGQGPVYSTRVPYASAGTAAVDRGDHGFNLRPG